MRKSILLSSFIVVGLNCRAADAVNATSPNGKLSVVAKGNGYVVRYDNRTVMEMPTVGMESTTAGTQGETRTALTYKGTVVADYEMVAGKRRHCTVFI